MILLPLLAVVGFFMKFVAGIFTLCALVLILVILIQKGKGGGLSSTFGGGGAGGGLLGSKTGDFLTWLTIALVGLFLGLAVLMAKFYKPSISEFEETQTQQMPAEKQQSSSAPGQTAPEIPKS